MALVAQSVVLVAQSVVLVAHSGILVAPSSLILGAESVFLGVHSCVFGGHVWLWCLNRCSTHSVNPNSAKLPAGRRRQSRFMDTTSMATDLWPQSFPSGGFHPFTFSALHSLGLREISKSKASLP